MPRIQGLLLTPNGPPTEMGIKVSKGSNNLPEVVQQVLGCSTAPVVSNCDLGVLYSTEEAVPGSEARNSLATQLRCKFSRKLPEQLGVTYGRCFLIGEDEKGSSANVEKKTVTTVFNLYQEMTGHSISGRKKSRGRLGPKRPKRDFDYFAGGFQKSRRSELADQKIVPVFATITKEAREAWDTMTSEEKAPYQAQAAEDRLRFERERTEYLMKNPPRPKNPRNPYNIYCQEYPDKNTRPAWKSLTDEQKAPYEQKAEADKGRYTAELEVFRKHCVETGKDFDTLTARKKRKVSDKPKAPRKPRAKADPKTKKQKKTPAKKARKSKKKAEPEPEAMDVEDDASESQSSESSEEELSDSD